MSTLTTVPAGGDAELQTGFLFSLLHNHLPDSSVAAAEPPGLDEEVCHAMQRVLAMRHNHALANRVRTELGRLATVAGEGSPAARAQATVELVLNVIMETAVSTAYASAPPMGPEGRRALLAAFDRVGVYARDDPFPAVVTVPCERRTNCRIFTAGGEPVSRSSRRRSLDFEVLRPVNGAAEPSGDVGLYSGSGRCYALVDKLRSAIYGSVVLAHVILVESAVAPNSESKGASGIVFRWTEECVAIKCIMKAIVNEKQRSGEPLNEDPFKEVQCLAYLTRRIAGTLAGPEVLRGDPQRVLPMVDCLKDGEENIYLVMPYLEGVDLMTTLEFRGGCPYPEPEACAIFNQIVDGLEVAHSLGLAHHDMSFENLMTDAAGDAVIIDWGMVVKVALTDRGIPVKVAARDSWPCNCGKKLYTAPEILEATDASPAFDPFKLDVWAIGIILFVLLTGMPPWSVDDGPTPDDARFQRITRGELHVQLDLWQIQLSAPAVEMLQALLRGDPIKRPTVAEVRDFRFISGGH